MFKKAKENKKGFTLAELLIVVAIIALVVAVITAFVIPWLKGKIDADKLEQIKLWVTVAVEAAEQLYNGTGRGEEKKAYVVKFLQEKGFTIDEAGFKAAMEEQREKARKARKVTNYH